MDDGGGGVIGFLVFTVFGGRHIHMSVESAVKGTQSTEAGQFGYFGNTVFREAKVTAGFGDAE